jgi:predicted amidohydrolase
MPLRVSLAQFDIIQADALANIETADRYAAEAARRGSELLVLPELWSTGLDFDNIVRYSSTNLAADMARLARRHRLFIYGSVFTNQNNRFANTGLLFGKDGNQIAQYSKLHLFRPMGEDLRLQPGKSVVVANTPWGRAGLAICYDLRFPELFRSQVADGATMVVIAAEWPYPRLSHWQTLLRARAIENQVFVIACNRVGEANGLRFCGYSVIIDPWGDVVAEGGDEEQLVTAEIDLARVDEVRRALPVLGDRRRDVFGAAIPPVSDAS